MREILFRGKKDDLPSEWVYGQLVVCENGDYQIGKCEKYGERYYRNKVFSDTVGQFTGLTDKNNTKIFEGDILKYVDCVDRDKCFCEAVEFINGVFRSANNTDSHILGYAYCSCSEVIGNIHDNPELLEVTQ